MKKKVISMTTNRIGLDKEKAAELSQELNILLSSYQMHYQNLRGLHWNIKGENFFELHLKYEELYTRAQVIIDDIAERILTLGATPLHTFSDYTSNSVIKAEPNLGWRKRHDLHCRCLSSFISGTKKSLGF